MPCGFKESWTLQYPTVKRYSMGSQTLSRICE